MSIWFEKKLQDARLQDTPFHVEILDSVQYIGEIRSYVGAIFDSAGNDVAKKFSIEMGISRTLHNGRDRRQRGENASQQEANVDEEVAPNNQGPQVYPVVEVIQVAEDGWGAGMEGGGRGGGVGGHGGDIIRGRGHGRFRGGRGRFGGVGISSPWWCQRRSWPWWWHYLWQGAWQV